MAPLAFAFNAIDGSAKIYLDGAKVTEFPKKGYAHATTWADLSPSITLGTMCYHAADGVSRECFLKNRMFNGLMDDFSLFVGAQSDAEIAQKWNASMADGRRRARPRCARSAPQPAFPAPPRLHDVGAAPGGGGGLVLLYDSRPPATSGRSPPGHGRHALVGERRAGHGRRPGRRATRRPLPLPPPTPSPTSRSR